MKNLITRLLLVGLITNCAISQTLHNHSADKKQVVFSEKFQDNRNGWSKFYTKIKKGRYSLETIGKDQAVVSTTPISLDTSRNYEIETVVSLEWNRSAEFMGIVWSRDLNNGYYLAFNKDYKTKVYKRENNSEIPMTLVEELNVFMPRYEKNIITIRRIESEFLIYINEIHVYTIPFNKQYGDHIGYFVGTASELRAYDLTVSYLD